MSNDPAGAIEEIVRRNVAALRAKANLTQQGLADEMLLRGIPWTRETVAQVETTSRRLGFTEAIAVAACLDVPLARLTTTGAAVVHFGESEWTSAYLGAVIAGTAADVFPPESYAGGPARPGSERWVGGTEWIEPPEQPESRDPGEPRDTRGERAIAPGPIPPGGKERRTPGSDRRRGDLGTARRRGRRSTDQPPATPASPPPATTRPIPASAPNSGRTPEPTSASQPQQRAAERIERRLRLRVTASDVDAAAQNLWSRSLESERERRVADRHALTGGSIKTIRGHVSRDLDRELAYEMEQRAMGGRAAVLEDLTPEEAAWEATRLNIVLANKGYEDSDITRWWNFTHHRELGEQTIAEAWANGEYDAVSRLIQSLPDQHLADIDDLD